MGYQISEWITEFHTFWLADGLLYNLPLLIKTRWRELTLEVGLGTLNDKGHKAGVGDGFVGRGRGVGEGGGLTLTWAASNRCSSSCTRRSADKARSYNRNKHQPISSTK